MMSRRERCQREREYLIWRTNTFDIMEQTVNGVQGFMNMVSHRKLVDSILEIEGGSRATCKEGENIINSMK